jgi:hypothetical protein
MLRATRLRMSRPRHNRGSLERFRSCYRVYWSIVPRGSSMESVCAYRNMFCEASCELVCAAIGEDKRCYAKDNRRRSRPRHCRCDARVVDAQPYWRREVAARAAVLMRATSREG